MTPAKLPVRLAAGWPAVIFVATALAFLPMQFLPSFDVPKLALLLVSAAVLVAGIARRRSGAARDGVLADPIFALPLAMTAVAAVGALLAWPRGSFVGPATAVGCLAVARLAAQSDDPRRAVRVFARGVAVAALVAGAYGLAQKAGLDFAPWRERREAVSTFGNTSFAAAFQAAALPFSLLLVLRGVRSPRSSDERSSPRTGISFGGTRRSDPTALAERALGAAAVFAGVAHLVAATSRIDYVAVAAGLGVATCLVLHGRGKSRAAIGLAVAGVAAAVLLAFAFFAAARGEGPAWLGRGDTVAVRAGVWRSTSRMIADAPLRVAGAPFIDTFPAWREADEYRISLGRRVETPHDDFLEIAVSLGIPGMLLALGVVALLARRLVATANANVAESAALGGSLAALAVSALASSPLSHPATALLPAVAAGLIVALAPRPMRGLALPARGADVLFVAALATCFWPGPAFRGLRSDGFVALGLGSKEKGDDARALSLLDDAAAIDPQAFDARFQLGCLLNSVGRTDEAIRALESARAVRPGDFDCVVNLAYALRNAHRRPEADELIDKGLARCAWHPLLLAARAIFALEDGRAADALSDARRAALGLPNDPRLSALAAEAGLAADPSESAYAAALDALVVLFERGETEELGRSTRSMLRRDRGLLGPLTSRARRIAPEKPGAASALVLAAASAVKDDAGFYDDASRILRLTGRDEESKILLGRSLGLRAAQALSGGQHEKALKFAEQAAERDPSSAHFLLCARAATKLGERDAAVEDVGAAVAAGEVDPDEVRRDPILSSLLPNRRLEDVLESAARRSGEKRSKQDVR